MYIKLNLQQNICKELCLQQILAYDFSDYVQNDPDDVLEYLMEQGDNVTSLNLSDNSLVMLQQDQQTGWSCPLKTIPLLFLIMPHKFSRRQHF
jgi:hypothetical protein